jgi:N-acetylmuramoyl-L-alanine amidase
MNQIQSVLTNSLKMKGYFDMADKRSKTDFIVIHCSATPAKLDVDAKEIDRWHKERGFLRIGYHYVIRRDGTREKGRDINDVGAHVTGFNHKSVGRMDEQNAEPEDNFSAEQIITLHITLTELRFNYPTAKIVGHRELDSAKACPSFDVQDWLKGFPDLR